MRKPSVDGQYHLIRLRIVVQRFRLIPKPEQLGFAVALADVGAKFHESVIHHVLERIRLGVVAGTLDGDGSLVVGIGGRTPASVLFLHIHTDPAIHADAVVTACLP